MTRKLGLDTKVRPEDSGTQNAEPDDQSALVRQQQNGSPTVAEPFKVITDAPPEVNSSSAGGEEFSTLASPVTQPGDADRRQDTERASTSKEAEAGTLVDVVVIQVQPEKEDCTGKSYRPETDASAVLRCPSALSTESAGEWCRICQQHAEEPLLELGCHCRGELAKAHKTCIEQWFGNKGSNKCEICQQVAENVPAPVAPAPHFWVWRLGYNRGSGRFLQRRNSPGSRFHPLWAALLILIAGLLFDVLISVFLGASALPVNIIIGVLVVLGIGTAARLVVECWHERGLRRNIRRMETEIQGDNAHVAGVQTNFVLQPAGLIRPLP